jgi:replicative DNA helicase
LKRSNGRRAPEVEFPAVTATTDGKQRNIPTGFPSLDILLGGGMRRGDLVTLGGDAGCGKSALALSMASRATRDGHTVIFLSAEMSAERIRERISAMELRMTVETARMISSDEHLEFPHVDVIPPGGDLDAIISALPADVEFVIVDNLQALAGHRMPLDEELAAAVRRLKGAALSTGAAVLLVAHTEPRRSDPTPPRPALSDFGALGAVRQHSDIVLGLFREEMYENARGIDGAAELHVLKNRHGTTGYVDLYFYKEWLRFEDMVEPGEEQSAAP